MPQPPEFATRLIAWQKCRGRHDLPWQQSRDPYRVWLSEIMLQQTQVAAVIPYFERFLERFPDLPALAAAPQGAVLEAWAGLGYYARAHNLHRCAQQVMAEHCGRFPDHPEALQQLAGIGRSTAAAIAVFAFGRRAAILDGNVKRVLCRHAGIDRYPGDVATERELWALAESLLPEKDIEAYTQGLMDLGATLCTHSRPRCGDCPLAEDCQARIQGKQGEWPVARPRAAIPERASTFVLITDGKGILLQRRPPSGIWGGLLTPPEGDLEAVLAQLGLSGAECKTLPPVRHAFTHFRLTITPVLCRIARPPMCEADWHWLPLAEAGSAALPTPVRKVLGAL